ncbi:MAG TPA: hypothetical protein VFX50_11440 [Gemmatimonadales bacterium]|nr:hypothetical protein [Gemmatimonadales bacterium]
MPGRLAALLLLAATAAAGARPPFALRATVRWAGLPMQSSVLEVPSLARRVEADSLGRLHFAGDAPAGCRIALLHVLGYGSFVWSFDPAERRTWDAGAVPLDAKPPDEAPLRVILGCPIPSDTLVAWSEGFAGVDTVLVLP